MADSTTDIPAHSGLTVDSRPLKSVINYTDEHGRTSCGSTELEHYQLRGVGLVEALKLKAVAIDRVTNEFKRLQICISASEKKSPAISEMFKTIDEVIAEKNDRVRAKSCLDQTLNIVTKKYTKLILKEMIGRIRAVLPQELVDLMWEHVTQQSLTMEINGQIHTVPLRRGKAKLIDHEREFTRSWYFDADVVGHQSALELRKFVWDTSTFRFEDRDALQHLLNTVIPHSLAPRCSPEHILVRASNLRIGNAESRAILVRFLTLMGNPRNSKAAIVLDIGSANPHWRKESEHKLPRDYKVHENVPSFTGTQGGQAKDVAHRSERVRASLDDPAYVMLVRDLQPLFGCLLNRGGTSYIIDEETCWRWVERSGRIEDEIVTRCVKCFEMHRPVIQY